MEPNPAGTVAAPSTNGLLARLRSSTPAPAVPPAKERREDDPGPSLVDGQIRYVSVSQLEKFDAAVYGGCNRRWWFRYVARQPEPQYKAQKLGTQVHAQIEHYLKTGDDVLGELARAGKRFIPEPLSVSPGIAVEALVHEKVTDTTAPVRSSLVIAGAPVIGFLDVRNWRGATQNGEGDPLIEPDVVEVLDWKSTKRINSEYDPDTGILLERGLAKTSEELTDTHQMVGYAEYARLLHPSAKAIRVSHVYFQTKGPRAAEKRSALISIDDVRARFRDRLEPVVEKMRAVARASRVEDVEPNYKACGAYGAGCPHKASCPRDARTVLVELLGGNAMGLLARMKSGTTNAPAAPAPAAASPPPPVTAAVNAEVEALKAEEAAANATPPASSITPPDAPAPIVTPTIIEQAAAAEKPVSPTEVIAAIAGATAEAVAEKPKRGRPKKAVEVVPTGSPPGSTESSYVTHLPLEHKTLSIFLDCVPDKVATLRLETYAQTKADELAAHFKTDDIRCAPGDSPLAFGKWKGALAAFVRAEPPAVDAYVVSSGSEFGMVAFEALFNLACVVRGVR